LDEAIAQGCRRRWRDSESLRKVGWPLTFSRVEQSKCSILLKRQLVVVVDEGVCGDGHENATGSDQVLEYLLSWKILGHVGPFNETGFGVVEKILVDEWLHISNYSSNLTK
jgi:hypothetical protein